MKVLITGSEGFIGSNVVSWLQSHTDWQIIGLDRLQSPRLSSVKYVCFDLGNLNNKERLINILNGCTAVIHLAADMRREPYETEVVRANCAGTQQLIEACESAKVETFIQLSSLPVIGAPKECPITEKHELCPPTVYHITKVCEELLADFAFRKHGMRTISFRISAPVGPRMNPSTIFPTFVKNALLGSDLTIYGKGSRKQTYVHVDDIAQAIYKSIDCPTVQGVYNLSSDNLIANLDLAKLCISILGSKSHIIFNGKDDPQDHMCWEVSIERIKRDAGYLPEMNIEECILQYATFLKAKKE